MTAADAAPTPRRALLFIFVTVTLNSLGIGLILPVMPDLLLELAPGEATIGAAAAWGGLLVASFSLMQFLFNPTLGNLSDAYGRRPVLLLSLFVFSANYLVMAVTPSLAILFLARIVAGMAAATLAVSNAFIADISPPEKRAQNFGLTGAAFGVGFVLGPALGGFLGELGTRAPFYAAAAIGFANFALGWVALPESLRDENRRPFQLSRANPVGAALQIRKYPAVAWMLVAVFVYNIAHYVYPVIWAYFGKLQFDWSPMDVGLSLTAVGVAFAFVQGFLIRKVIPWLGEVKTVIAGLTLDVASLALVAFATEGWMAYALIPFMSLSALVAPAAQALMANRVPDDAQGELQGAVSALSSLSFIITPIIMSQVFFLFTAEGAAVYFPGAPFILAALFSAASIPLFLKGARGA